MPTSRRYSALDTTDGASEMLDIAVRLPRSFTWYSSVVNSLKTFSVVNDFLFAPGPPSYDFGATDESELKMAHGQSVVTVFYLLRFIPWTHLVHVDNLRYGLGRRPFAFHGGCPIPMMHVRCSHPRLLFLFFHGNACDVGSTVEFLASLTPFGVESVCPEYPGFGLHVGEPSELAAKRTAERTLQYILSTAHVSTLQHLVVGGQSVGTGVALHLVQTIVRACRSVLSQSGRDPTFFPPWMKLGGILLKSPFASVKEVITGSFPTPTGWDEYLACSLDRVVPLSALLEVRMRSSDDAAAAESTLRKGVVGKLITFGVQMTANRFNSFEVLKDLQVGGYLSGCAQWKLQGANEAILEDACPPVSVLLLHGNQDTVIPHRHSLKLLTAFADPLPAVQQKAFTQEWAVPPVSICLLSGQGHNDLNCAAQVETWFGGLSSQWTVPSPQTAGVPAEAVVLSPPLYESTGGGTPPDVPTQVARRSHVRHRLLVATFRRIVTCMVLLYAVSLFVGCGLYIAASFEVGEDAAAATINNVSQSTSRSLVRKGVMNISVLAWYLGEGLAFLLGAVVHTLSARFALAVLRRQSHARRWQLVFYLVVRVVAYLFALAFGLIVGPLLIWNVDWSVSGLASRVGLESVSMNAALLGWPKVAILLLPRALMFVSFILHSAHLMWTGLRNR